MKFNYIVLQICRNNDTAFDIGEFEFLRESCTVSKFVSNQSRDQSQNILFGKRGCYHWEYIIHNLKDRGKTCYLCFIKEHSKYTSLTLCTSHIQTCCITDTAVRSYLYTIQMISSNYCFLILRFRFRFLNRSIIPACQFGSLNTVIVHMLNLCIGQWHIQTSKIIYHFYEC